MWVLFFCPKDIRHYIRHLAQQGNLNKSTLQNFQTYSKRQYLLLTMICLLVIIPVGIFFVPQLNQRSFIALLPYIAGYAVAPICAFLILELFSIRRMAGKFGRLYRYGIPGKGNVINYAFTRGWILSYRYNVEEKEYIGNIHNISDFFKDRPYQKGEKISILYNKEDPQDSIPDLPFFRDCFNFAKITNISC